MERCNDGGTQFNWKFWHMETNSTAKKKSIDVKWIFKVKSSPKGTIVKHKSRLVAKDFLQRQGLDYS